MQVGMEWCDVQDWDRARMGSGLTYRVRGGLVGEISLRTFPSVLNGWLWYPRGTDRMQGEGRWGEGALLLILGSGVWCIGSEPQLLAWKGYKDSIGKGCGTDLKKKYQPQHSWSSLLSEVQFYVITVNSELVSTGIVNYCFAQNQLGSFYCLLTAFFHQGQPIITLSCF